MNTYHVKSSMLHEMTNATPSSVSHRVSCFIEIMTKPVNLKWNNNSTYRFTILDETRSGYTIDNRSNCVNICSFSTNLKFERICLPFIFCRITKDNVWITWDQGLTSTKQTCNHTFHKMPGLLICFNKLHITDNMHFLHNMRTHP